MPEKKVRWTKQQLSAIGARGSDVLVSASAGTGKTAVLSARCVDIVSDRQVCPDVNSLLVLTFTEAAAEQMRQRIAEQLRQAFQANRDGHLRYQLMLLQGSDISTIHSFCKRTITQYFYRLGLDPTFRVIDDDEQQLLKAEVLEKTIDWAWQQEHLAAGMNQLLIRRDLRTHEGFLSRVVAVSDFLDGVESRQKWFARAGALIDAAGGPNNELGQKQKRMIIGKMQGVIDQLRHCRRVYLDACPAGAWAGVCEDTFIRPVEQCLEPGLKGDWDECARRIMSFKKQTVQKPAALEDEVLVELIKSTVKKGQEMIEGLKELAVINPDYLDRVGGSAGLQTRVMIELVRKFDLLYGKAKRSVSCLDFADLEHYALELLTDEASAGDKPAPSETAIALRKKYRHIFVDEYQDINAVQKAILDRLSGGGNVFVVGDVKQSIYAWRGAEPEIFLRQLRQASPATKSAAAALRVDLNTNFRSRKALLDFVNKVFGRIMTCSVAQMQYDEAAMLRAGEDTEKGQSADGAVVELHLLDKPGKDAQAEEPEESAGEESGNAISHRQRQAAVIGRRILQMVGAETGRAQFEIHDKPQNQMRPVDYRDIVILMRSVAGKADFVEVLQLAGIPVNCDGIAGYFETTEISDMLCLLKVLDNPQRDIELAAVLRSPLFKVTDTELAGIKLHGGTREDVRNFYDAVTLYGRNGPDVALAGRVRDIFGQVARWRALARRGNLAQMLWQVYRQSGYLSFVSALANGPSRRANLLKLHDRAIQFEGFAGSAGVPSLTRFVEFIEKLQKLGQDWSPAAAETAAENAVRILSVHKSKGLEFPVVFLAELDAQFNRRDVYDDCLADGDDTIGLNIIDRESNSKLSSLGHQVIAEEKLSMSLAEEMRIFYVATTRARERLIVTAAKSWKKCGQILRSGFSFGSGPVGEWQLRACRSCFEWLLYGLCDQKSLHAAFETGLAARAVDEGLFDVKLYARGEIEELSAYVRDLKDSWSAGRASAAEKAKPTCGEGPLPAKVKDALGWRYRFGDIPQWPAKLSVTQLTHRDDEYVRFDYSRALERKPAALVAADENMSAPADDRVVGTATHLVISGLDLDRPVTAGAIEESIKRLVGKGALTEALAGQVNRESIFGFFRSALGRTVVEGGGAVRREWPFTLAIPATQWQGQPGLEIAGSAGETIIVQGIIDMLIERPDGLIVIDFKTDRVTGGRVSERAELYRRQMELYGRAARSILKAAVAARWLYFLTPGVALEM